MSTPAGLPTSADIEAMKNAEPIFQNALDAVNTSLNNMTTQQDTLTANWVGETATGFGMALTSYLEDLGKVRVALVNVMNTMGQTTGIYANTQEQSQQVQAAFSAGVNSAAFHGLAGLNLGG